MKRTRIVLCASLAALTVTAVPASTGAEGGPSRDVERPGDEAPGQRRDQVTDELEPAGLEPAEGVDRTEGDVQIFGRGADQRTYLIRFNDPAVPTNFGDQSGTPRTAPRGTDQLDTDAADVRDYRGDLEEAQLEFIDRMERTTGRDVEVPFTYQHAVNGIAAVLTPDEAREVADDPDVADISLDQERELHTDAGPAWQGSEALWNAMEELSLPEDVKGEGIVIGTIDTGIAPGSSSFAEAGADGFTPTNPLGEGNFLGACDPDNTEQYDPDFECNSKLIGAYGFLSATDTSAVDADGHGSHTASTSGGNVVEGVVPEAPTGEHGPFDISGVAPHANVISYRGCCTLSGLTMSIEQAIIDEVDVINYSIGSSSPSQLWSDFDSVGFLNARAAGIFVATSNGNDGPLDATTGSPADAPWITSTGASTHNRHNGNLLTGLTSSNGDLPDIEGKSVTGSLAAAPIVLGADFGSATCGEGSVEEPINPFPAGTFDGEIVVCERGVVGRVQKSVHLADAGAGGIVHVNDELNGDSLLGDGFQVPGLHISYDDGQALMEWLANGADDHQAAIAGTEFVTDDARGDIMASFSSRGPNRAVDVIVPDVTAPGVDILAALADGTYDGDITGYISGTSMSSPHVAGAGALLTQARSDWTPAQMQSALMTTARNTVLDFDGSDATPFDQGSGHVNVGDAATAGLLFDETADAYLGSNPEEGGDPRTLNLPSFANSECLVSCSWERTATVPVNDDAPVPDGVTWTVDVAADEGLALDVSLSQDTVSPGDSMDIAVNADVSGAEAGTTLFGWITLTPSNPDVPTVTMPVAVEPSTGVLPGSVDVDTRRNAGSQVVSGIESIEVTDFTASVSGMVPATIETGELEEDPTNGDPYNNLDEVDVYTIDVPEGASRLVAEMLDTEVPDLDLFIGTGTTPSAATEACASTSSGSAEHCELSDPEAGTYWVVVQSWAGSEEQPDAYTLATAVVSAGDLGNAGVDGPEGTVPTGEPYDIRFHWDIPEMEAGDRWYGTIVLGSSPETPGDIGSIPVTIRRADDDVTKTASVEEAETGDTISYEVTVQPNVTDTDLTYTITDTVPDGLSIDPGSVTGGGVVDGQTITWEIDMPTPAGVVGEYVASTPATNPQCADWSGFLDLAEAGVGFAGLDGDTVAGTAFSGIGPFEHYGAEFPALTVAEDGLVTVAGGYGGAPWEPQVLPDAELPNGVIAPLWADLELSLDNERGMRLAQANDGTFAVVQWDDPMEFGGDPTDPASSVGKFQTWIYTTVSDQRPEITFEYGELGALPPAATIGIENIDGDLATSVLDAADPAAILEEGGSICLDYEGPSFDAATVGYDVVVDEDATSGTYTNDAVHVTDDPYAQPATASVDVEISGVDPIECTTTIDDQHSGPLNVTEGVTCLDGASVSGPVRVEPGAGLVSDGSRISGPVRANGAVVITLCGTEISGPVKLRGGESVTLGDPDADCAPNTNSGPITVAGTSGPVTIVGNTVSGPVTVNDTTGPSVIGGNTINGPLKCSGNEPPPVNNDMPNQVTGPKKGQCAAL